MRRRRLYSIRRARALRRCSIPSRSDVRRLFAVQPGAVSAGTAGDSSSFRPCLPHRMRRMRMLSPVSADCRVRMRPQDPFCSCRTPRRGCSLCARPLRGWCSRWISFRTIGKGNRGQRYDFSGFCNSENRVIFVSGIRHKREPTMKTRRFWSLCLILSALLLGSCAVHRPPGPRPPRPPHEAPPPPHHGPKRRARNTRNPNHPSRRGMTTVRTGGDAFRAGTARLLWSRFSFSGNASG